MFQGASVETVQGVSVETAQVASGETAQDVSLHDLNGEQNFESAADYTAKGASALSSHTQCLSSRFAEVHSGANPSAYSLY